MTGFVQEDADLRSETSEANLTTKAERSEDRAERAAGNPYAPLDWSVGTMVEKLVAERCAPLVEFAEEVADEPLAGPYRVLARAALAAYHAAQGAGRGT